MLKPVIIFAVVASASALQPNPMNFVNQWKTRHLLITSDVGLRCSEFDRHLRGWGAHSAGRTRNFCGARQLAWSATDVCDPTSPRTAPCVPVWRHQSGLHSKQCSMQRMQVGCRRREPDARGVGRKKKRNGRRCMCMHTPKIQANYFFVVAHEKTPDLASLNYSGIFICDFYWVCVFWLLCWEQQKQQKWSKFSQNHKNALPASQNQQHICFGDWDIGGQGKKPEKLPGP